MYRLLMKKTNWILVSPGLDVFICSVSHSLGTVEQVLGSSYWTRAFKMEVINLTHKCLFEGVRINQICGSIQCKLPKELIFICKLWGLMNEILNAFMRKFVPPTNNSCIDINNLWLYQTVGTELSVCAAKLA